MSKNALLLPRYPDVDCPPPFRLPSLALGRILEEQSSKLSHVTHLCLALSIRLYV